MNVYDFDKTIYDGDSTVDFYCYCLLKRPDLIFCLPRQMWSFVQYAERKINTAKFKEDFFCFLPKLSPVNVLVEGFWVARQKKIKAWYLAQKRQDDVIISASPEFLLAPVCETLGIACPIATRLDKATGEIKGENCKGKEKVRRFLERYGAEEIEDFYSDSQSDVFLARMAKNAFFVKKDMIRKWRF